MSTSKPKKEFPRPAEKRTEKQWKHLNQVIDPELGIGIVDLGLVYDLEIDEREKSILVTLTLTSPGCPVAPMILQDIETVLLTQNPDYPQIRTEIVWDPVWTHEKMDPDLRDMMLGI